MSQSNQTETILITGVAGFIGYHLAENLIKKGYCVVGIDNINDYYAIDLKYGRLNELKVLQRVGEIKDLQTQVRYNLIPSQKICGKTERCELCR